MPRTNPRKVARRRRFQALRDKTRKILAEKAPQAASSETETAPARS